MRQASIRVERDFSDVRDMVRACAWLLKRGPGEAHNLTYGRNASVGQILTAVAIAL